MVFKIKCITLNPKSEYPGDPYAKASRMAIHVYAAWIKDIDKDLHKNLVEWVREEQNIDMANKAKEDKG
jgi:hypothetical protein